MSIRSRLLPLALAFLWGCGGVPAQAQIQVKVLQINSWQEGTQVSGGFDSLVSEILGSGAQIVALEEIRNYNHQDFITRLLTALNAGSQGPWNGKYVSGDVGIISSFPILSNTMVGRGKSGDVVRARINAGGREVVVYAAHLDYTHYATYLPRGYNDGGSLYPGWDLIDNGSGQPAPVTNFDAIHAENTGSTRQAAIQKFIGDADGFATSSPVILMGDFNEPSHLDWTVGTRDSYDHHGVVYGWDTTALLSAHGYQDAYRTLHPSPVTHPGFTWPAVAGNNLNTSWALKADERDRIDFVFFKGPGITPTEAIIWGPSQSIAVGQIVTESGGDTFQKATANWPTDHKGVRVTFTLQ